MTQHSQQHDADRCRADAAGAAAAAHRRRREPALARVCRLEEVEAGQSLGLCRCRDRRCAPARLVESARRSRRLRRS